MTKLDGDSPPSRLGPIIRPGVHRIVGGPVHDPAAAHLEMDEEIRLHLEARIDEFRTMGLTDAEAEAEAQRRFGAGEAARMRLHASAARRNRRLRWGDRVERFGSDLRYAVRGLLKQPSFSLGVVLTLTLGLGINSAMFRIGDRLFIRPPAGVRDPGSLRRLGATRADGAGGFNQRLVFSYPTASTLATIPSIQQLVVYTVPVLQKLVDGRTVSTSAVGSGYSQLLGVRPSVGRFFDADELRPGANIATVVVSYAFWRREFGGNPAAIGRSITIDGSDYRIVGVGSPEFVGVDLDPVDIWIPLGAKDLGHATINGIVVPWFELSALTPLRILVHLRRGTPDVAAIADIQRVMSVAGGGESVVFRNQNFVLPSLNGAVSDGNHQSDDTSRQILQRFAVVACLILLMAAANSTNLLLARALRRRREIAVRLALGVSRRRLIWQLVTEGLVLSTVAAAAALIVGYWASSALRAVLFPQARWTEAALDGRVILFTVAVSLLIGVIVGVIPALQASRLELTSALSGGTALTHPRSRRTRDALVVVQAALSVVLLIGAGLFVQSLRALTSTDLGMRPDGLVTVSFPIIAAERHTTGAALPGITDVTTVEEAAARIRQVPGVRAVALASIVPLDAVSYVSLALPGQDSLPATDAAGPYSNGITPEYFATLGTRIIQGRGITAQDDAGAARVVVVNRSMAAIYWPGRNAVGQCITIGNVANPCSQVVGVAEDVRDKPNAPPILRYYVSLEQMSPAAPAAAAIIRTELSRTALLQSALQRMTFLGSPLRILAIKPRVTAGLRPWVVGTIMFGAVGLLALTLASVGLSSTLMYIFSERTREIGVRFALGATGRSIATLVVGAGLRLVGIGFILGTIAGFLGAHAMASLIVGITPNAPLVYVATGLVLGFTAILACAWPAWRARRVDPAVVLRVE